jgi:hypothetical protein
VSSSVDCPTIVGKIAAAALWVVAAFYDLSSLNETTAFSAPNLHADVGGADALLFPTRVLPNPRTGLQLKTRH